MAHATLPWSLSNVKVFMFDDLKERKRLKTLKRLTVKARGDNFFALNFYKPVAAQQR